MLTLVTGGAGFIGRHLVNSLLAMNGDTVRAFDNESRGKFSGASGPRLECIPGDIREASDLRRAMQSCDSVFHLAADATVMGCEHRPFDAHEVNATGTLTVLRIAKELGVRRVVVASSREVYGEACELPVSESTPMRPKNVYGATKAAAEAHCARASSDLQVVILRLSNVYGPGDTDRVIPRFIGDAENNRPLTVYGGNQIVDFVWVNYVVEAFVRAGLHSRGVGALNVASGNGITILEAARRVIQLCHSDSTPHILAAREAEVSKFVADVRKMEQELGVAVPPDPLKGLAALCRPIARRFSELPASHAETGS